MKIGIIGAGNIGATLGRLWHQAGHEVYFGTRHPEQLQALAKELGPRAHAGTAEDAARAGEVILLAVPLHAVPSVATGIGKLVSGKGVLDACNAYPARDGEAASTAMRHAAGSTGWVASHLPGARVVKAFNTVFFRVLQTQANREREDGVGIPLAGDDAHAVATAGELVRDAGFSPVVVGSLSKGKLFEPGTAVYNTGMSASEVARALGVTS